MWYNRETKCCRVFEFVREGFIPLLLYPINSKSFKPKAISYYLH